MNDQSVDAAAKADGLYEYANDLPRRARLHAATIRSSCAAAKVVDLDVRRALAMPGVVQVITAADVPGDTHVGKIRADTPVLAADEVRYHGEPIALVVADSSFRAAVAAAAVDVRYERLPAVVDARESLAAGTRLVHPDGNLLARVAIRHGAAERPVQHRVEGSWSTGRQEHAFLAPEAALAQPIGDGIVLWTATQDLHDDRRQVAAALGLSIEQVEVRLAGVGGAFGGREDVTLQVHCALAALLTGVDVGMTYTRPESMLAHPKRHPAHLLYEMHADGDGLIQHVCARIVLDGGPYASTSAAVVRYAAYFAVGPYDIPSIDVEVIAVRTNNPVSGAFRGFGATQACFGIESAIEMLAARIGIDPVDVRRRNALQPGRPLATTRQVPRSPVPVIEVIDRCAALPLPTMPPAIGTRRGVGFAVGVKSCGLDSGEHEHAAVALRLDDDGVHVAHTAADVGQGVDTVIIRALGEVLGSLPIIVARPSTDYPAAGSASASRLTPVFGAALRMAADELLARATARAGNAGACSTGDVLLRDGRFVTADGLDVTGAVMTAPIEVEVDYAPPSTEPAGPDGTGELHNLLMVVAHRAVVDVDEELGTIRVVQIATAQDVGRAIHRDGVFGQIVGGTVQGLGLALTEHLDATDGIVTNNSLGGYLIPTAFDVPEIVVDVIESGAAGPLGAKGAGEPPAVSSTVAIANAVRDATGLTVESVPISPASVAVHFRRASEARDYIVGG